VPRYENVNEDYLDQRQLKSGAAGWVLLAGLGVAYVISATSPAGTSAWRRVAGADC
jgi:hypothetical protein